MDQVPTDLLFYGRSVLEFTVWRERFDAHLITSLCFKLDRLPTDDRRDQVLFARLSLHFPNPAGNPSLAAVWWARVKPQLVADFEAARHAAESADPLQPAPSRMELFWSAAKRHWSRPQGQELQALYAPTFDQQEQETPAQYGMRFAQQWEVLRMHVPEPVAITRYLRGLRYPADLPAKVADYLDMHVPVESRTLQGVVDQPSGTTIVCALHKL